MSGRSPKIGAALVSVASNSILIAVKVVAGLLTGSIAILTEAVHSAVDLVASFVALFSIRVAEEPADEEHPYGHEKAENVAAGAEAMLILVGAGIVAFEAIRRLGSGNELDYVGIGIAVIAVSATVNIIVSAYLSRSARRHESPALEGDAAHLRADAWTSIAVLVGLVLVEVTGEAAFDSIAALVVAVAIVASGVRLLNRSTRVLMDEALPAEELDRVEAVIADVRPPEMAGYHKLRGRQAGARRHLDMHVQFRSGTSLELAHERAHALRDAIEAAIPNSEVLIHVEPQASVKPQGEHAPHLRHG